MHSYTQHHVSGLGCSSVRTRTTMCLPTIFALTAFDGSRFTSRISIWREGCWRSLEISEKRIDRCSVHITDQRWQSPTLSAALMRETFTARDRSPPLCSVCRKRSRHAAEVNVTYTPLEKAEPGRDLPLQRTLPGGSSARELSYVVISSVSG